MGRAWLRVGGAFWLLGGFVLVAAQGCGGSAVETGIDADASGGSRPLPPGSGGQFEEPGSGGSGTGGEPYVEQECPDEEPPEIEQRCDPLEPLLDCGFGFGCFPYLEYPFGEGCGHASRGTICAPAGTAEQGDLCGDDEGLCAPGFMCVVGAGGGKRCGKICEPVRDHGCPAGLVGVCF